MFTRDQITAAAEMVHRHVPPTPCYSWPLLVKRTGADVWVKHENHTPIGAFKVRGGIIYLDAFVKSGSDAPGLITATRGNHGQSIPWAARLHGVPVTIYVPLGNSPEKNAAMRALGAELVEYGSDFDEAAEECARAADARGLHFVRAFDEDLVRGVASYPLELFSAHNDLDTVYVPIGMGSGICAMIATRDALGLKTKVVGVVAEGAPAYARSFAAGKAVALNEAATFAGGIACRNPDPDAVAIINKGAERIVEVSDEEIATAIRALFEDTHNVAEGAGAAPLAGLLKERDAMAGKKVAVILCGGNIDTASLASIFAGQIPDVG